MVRTRLHVDSPKLGRAIPYSIYIPATDRAQPLPVLYLLHGRGDNEMAWLERGAIREILDGAIASKKIQPLVVVMPSAGNSWYVDDPRTGGYGPVADAFTSDLIAGIERTLPSASRCREGRAVGGLSMGGFGAVLYALDRPDLFKAAFSLSGSLFSNKPEDIERRMPNYERMFEGVYGVPFDTGRFLKWNVFGKLDSPKLETNRVALWLSAGDKDFASILSGTIRLHDELSRRNFVSELHVMQGDHTWPLWQEAVQPALMWLSARLDPQCKTVPDGTQRAEAR